jgi:hypothetical protein
MGCAASRINSACTRTPGIWGAVQQIFEAGRATINKAVKRISNGAQGAVTAAKQAANNASDQVSAIGASALRETQFAAGNAASLVKQGQSELIAHGETNRFSFVALTTASAYIGDPIAEALGDISDGRYLAAGVGAVLALVPAAKALKYGDEVVAMAGDAMPGAKAAVREIREAGVGAANSVDKSWKLKIDGSAQKTGTPVHQFRTYREAIAEAKNPDVSAVHLDHGYNRALGLNPKTISPNRRPDVTSIYYDGTVKRIEVQSRTDIPAVPRSRNSALDRQLIDSGFIPTPPVVVRPHQ